MQQHSCSQKSVFFMILGSIFVVVFVDPGIKFDDFWCVGDSLECDDFPWPPGCAPEMRVGRKWVVITCFLGSTKPVRQHCTVSHASQPGAPLKTGLAGYFPK